MRLIIYTIYVLIGGWWFASAIRTYKDECYFLTGVNIMLLVYNIVNLIEYIL